MFFELDVGEISRSSFLLYQNILLVYWTRKPISKLSSSSDAFLVLDFVLNQGSSRLFSLFRFFGELFYLWLYWSRDFRILLYLKGVQSVYVVFSSSIWLTPYYINSPYREVSLYNISGFYCTHFAFWFPIAFYLLNLLGVDFVWTLHFVYYSSTKP